MRCGGAANLSSIHEFQESGEHDSSRRRLSKSVESSGTPKKSESNGALLSKGDKLIEAETSETGRVKFSVYSHYFKSVGWPLTITTLIFHIIFQGKFRKEERTLLSCYYGG